MFHSHSAPLSYRTKMTEKRNTASPRTGAYLVSEEFQDPQQGELNDEGNTWFPSHTKSWPEDNDLRKAVRWYQNLKVWCYHHLMLSFSFLTEYQYRMIPYVYLLCEYHWCVMLSSFYVLNTKQPEVSKIPLDIFLSHSSSRALDNDLRVHSSRRSQSYVPKNTCTMRLCLPCFWRADSPPFTMRL